jgi:hypothetical protein
MTDELLNKRVNEPLRAEPDPQLDRIDLGQTGATTQGYAEAEQGLERWPRALGRKRRSESPLKFAFMTFFVQIVSTVTNQQPRSRNVLVSRGKARFALHGRAGPSNPCSPLIAKWAAPVLKLHFSIVWPQMREK